jgi:hypothetical protein
MSPHTGPPSPAHRLTLAGAHLMAVTDHTAAPAALRRERTGWYFYYSEW